MAINRARRQQSRERGDGTPFTFPAPTGGLNLRDDVSALPPDKARELKNWLPDIGVMKPRKGYSSQSAGAGTAAVSTIAVFEGAASRKPIAVAAGEIWDISGTTASSIFNGSYSNNNFVTANFNGYIFGVNGVSTPWRYDGSAHSATGFTGPTLTTLATVAVVRTRLWFAVTDSATFYYGGLGGVTGALTAFNVAEIADGGRGQAVFSWSRDAGDGADDVTVFYMNTGQLIIYQGDPASTFSLIGKYKAPPPIGRRCWVRVGGDVILITRMGYIPLSAVVSGALTEGGSVASSIPVWGEIASGVAADALAYGSLDGWMGIFWNGLVIFNVPILSGNSKQYVLNTRKNAWTTFDYPAADFADNDGTLIFGGLSGGNAWKSIGSNDNGLDIELISRSGYIRSPNNANWRATMIRPYLTGDGAVAAIIDVDMNYEGRPFSGDMEQLLQGVATGGDWGDDWGVDWAGGSGVYNRWQSVKGIGSSMAVIAKMQTQAENVTWNQTQVMVKPAGHR